MRKFLCLLACLMGCALLTSAQTLFEGEIKYRNFENHSKNVRKFSKGMAYNGARNVRVLIKGNRVNILDESLHLNTLILPDEDCVIIYNDLLKKGLKCSYTSYTRQYMSQYGPNCYLASQTKNYNIKNNGQTKTINGEECIGYSGILETFVNGGSPTKVVIETWCSTKYKINPSYWYYLYGLEVPGIAVKWTINSQGKVPLFGTMSSFIASEVTEIIPRQVDDSEMQIPTNYELKETNSPFKMLKIYSETKKYLKKNKMYPADADEDTDVTYSIEEEWDF